MEVYQNGVFRHNQALLIFSQVSLYMSITEVDSTRAKKAVSHIDSGYDQQSPGSESVKQIYPELKLSNYSKMPKSSGKNLKKI